MLPCASLGVLRKRHHVNLTFVFQTANSVPQETLAVSETHDSDTYCDIRSVAACRLLSLFLALALAVHGEYDFGIELGDIFKVTGS